MRAPRAIWMGLRRAALLAGCGLCLFPASSRSGGDLNNGGCHAEFETMELELVSVTVDGAAVSSPTVSDPGASLMEQTQGGVLAARLADPESGAIQTWTLARQP